MPISSALSPSNSIRDAIKADFYRTEESIWNTVSKYHDTKYIYEKAYR